MRLAVAGLGLALLSACGGEQAPPQTAEQQNRLIWESQTTGAGAALILRGHEGAELLRLYCARDPAVMGVDVSIFTNVGGGQALSLNVGPGAPFVFPTSVEGGGAGVHGEGPIPGDLFDKLGRSETISASYGSQYFGPYPAPERPRSMEFTNACRQIVERESE